MTVEPAALDLPTLAMLAGSASADRLMARVRERAPGLRASHGYLIQLLVDDAPTVGEIAQRLGVTQQAASKQVGELEALAFVTRAADAGDSRVRRVTLTDAGRDLLDSARAERQAIERQVTATGVDLEATKAGLLALLDASGGMDAVRRRRVRPPSV